MVQYVYSDSFEIKSVKAIKRTYASSVTISAGGSDQTLIDSSFVSGGIKIKTLVLTCNNSGGGFDIQVYNKDGSTTRLQAIASGPGFTSTVYLYLSDVYNYSNVERKQGLWAVENWDTSNNRYTVSLRKEIECYGVKVIAHNPSGTTDMTFGCLAIYEEYE